MAASAVEAEMLNASNTARSLLACENNPVASTKTDNDVGHSIQFYAFKPQTTLEQVSALIATSTHKQVTQWNQRFEIWPGSPRSTYIKCDTPLEGQQTWQLWFWNAQSDSETQPHTTSKFGRSLQAEFWNRMCRHRSSGRCLQPCLWSTLSSIICQNSIWNTFDTQMNKRAGECTLFCSSATFTNQW